MDFEHLLELIGNEPVFETALLLAGPVDPNLVRLQLTRWTKSGRLYQLRRGLYALAPPYQKVRPHPFLVANRLQRASYVSLQTALAFHGLIPDTVQATLSVTTGRPGRWKTPLGVFEYRHVAADLLSGYHLVDLRGQQALVASPEKALLDLAYLQPGASSPDYLLELRLQNLDRLNLPLLHQQAKTFGAPRLLRAAASAAILAEHESEDFVAL